MLAGKLGTLKRVYREKGVLALVDTALKKVFPSGNPWLSWNSRVLLLCPVHAPADAGPGAPLSDEEALQQAPDPAARRAARAALERGEVCWAIHEDGAGKGRVIARVWIGGPWKRIISDTAYPLRRDESAGAWWWRDVYVPPQCRGRGLARALFDAWRASLPPGEHCLYTEVDPANPPSLRAHEKMGFRELARLRMLCLLGLRIYRCRGQGQPRLSLRFLPRNTYFSATR